MWVRSVTAQGWGLGNSSESCMMQETPRLLMNKKYLVRLTGPARDVGKVVTLYATYLCTVTCW